MRPRLVVAALWVDEDRFPVATDPVAEALRGVKMADTAAYAVSFDPEHEQHPRLEAVIRSLNLVEVVEGAPR